MGTAPCYQQQFGWEILRLSRQSAPDMARLPGSEIWPTTGPFTLGRNKHSKSQTQLFMRFRLDSLDFRRTECRQFFFLLLFFPDIVTWTCHVNLSFLAKIQPQGAFQMMAISIMHVKSNIENLLFPSMNTAVNILIAAALSKKIKKNAAGSSPTSSPLRVSAFCVQSGSGKIHFSFLSSSSSSSISWWSATFSNIANRLGNVPSILKSKTITAPKWFTCGSSSFVNFLSPIS